MYKSTLKRFSKYLKKEKKSLIIVIIIVIISTILSTLGPLFLSIILDKYLGIKNNILPILFLLLIINITYPIFNYLTSFIMTNVSEKVLYNLRLDLFSHLEKLPLKYFDKNKKGDLMSRFTNDTAEISNTLSDSITDLISSVIMLLGATVIMFIINPLLAILSILIVPIFFILAFIVGNKSGKYFDKQKKQIGEVNTYSEEIISNMIVVKNYNGEEKILKKFSKKNNELKDVSVKAEFFSNIISPLNTFINNLSSIILISVGSLLIMNGKTTIGIMISFISYAAMFRNPINNLGATFSSIQSALAGLRRIFEVLDEKIEITNNNNIEITEGKIEFKNLNFSYDEKQVLNNINLKIKSNTTLAIIGKTGSGKTTIASLLTKFYNVEDNRIFIDDKDINEYKTEYIRNNIGVVLQDTYLFKGTIEENIRFGNISASKEEIEEAIKLAGADRFVNKLPNKYNYMIEDGGKNLSSGEAELISIARTILANPKILILDEATSNVDTKTEQEINLGMKELMKGKTTLIIAHKLSTVKNADKIIVLENGTIKEEGNHKKLLEKKGLYYNLYKNSLND